MHGRNLVNLVPLALLVLAGCATRDDLYVLLPGKGNNPGALTVTSGDEQRTLDQPYAAARVTRSGSVSGDTSSESEVKATFGPARWVVLGATAIATVGIALFVRRALAEPVPAAA